MDVLDRAEECNVVTLGEGLDFLLEGYDHGPRERTLESLEIGRCCSDLIVASMLLPVGFHEIFYSHSQDSRDEGFGDLQFDERRGVF